MKYYAIGDLHGRNDLLQKALIKIHEHAKDEEHKIITLGDYIDRGPESRQVIEHLMLCGDQIICLQGNHEDMAVHCISKETDADWWMGNGGNTTLKSYGHPNFTLDKYYRPEVYWSVVPKEHVKWMASLPKYYETEKQLFVHAGVPQWNMNLPPKKVPRYLNDEMQWMLYHPADHGGWKGKHVVHGHHQFADGPHQWLDAKKGGRTNLDVYAWKHGRSVIGVFDDTQLHAKEFLEVTDEGYSRGS